MDAALGSGATGAAVQALADLLQPARDEQEGLTGLAGLVCDWAVADPVAEAWTALQAGPAAGGAGRAPTDPGAVGRVTRALRTRRMLCAAGMLRDAAAARPSARLGAAVSTWVARVCEADPAPQALADWAALLASQGSFCPAAHLDVLLATGRLARGSGHRALLAELPPALLGTGDGAEGAASRYAMLWTHLVAAGQERVGAPPPSSSGELEAFLGAGGDQRPLDVGEAELEALQARLRPWLAVPVWAEGAVSVVPGAWDWAAAVADLASARYAWTGEGGLVYDEDHDAQHGHSRLPRSCFW